MTALKQRGSLTEKTGRAVGYRLGGNVALVLQGLALGVILARILPPHEFGVFAVGLGIITVADIISNAGMFQALVQRKDLRPEDETTGFVLQLSFALVLGTCLVLLGPYFARFFKMPGLGLLIQLQSAVLVIKAFSLIPNTRLMRGLAFDRVAFMDVVSRLLGGLVAIALGLRGLGALALTGGALTTAVVSTGLGWYFASGAIPLKLSRESARALTGYGTGVLASRIFNDLARRVDVFIIGRRLGPEIVGFYNRAYQLITIPLFQFTNAINQVLFPAMAKVQNDDERFRRGFLGSVSLSTMVAFPMLTLLWTCGDVLIPFLYGPRWSGAVPLLTLLSFAGYLRVINNPNGLVTQARARVGAEAWRQAGFTFMIGVFVLLGTIWGITGAVIGVGVSTSLYLFFMTRLALSIAAIPMADWLRALKSTVLGTVAMSVAILAAKDLLVPWLPSFALLATLSLLGCAVYLLAVRFLLSPVEREILERVGTVLPVRLSWLPRLVLGVGQKRVAAVAAD
ncbi:MAG: lipopolysaccharide biosynthesis protein [Acidobacteria bacterium]|nr:MAG: lipopolysaccharide biosynthesis protein [Acidobacteriota bacterium]